MAHDARLRRAAALRPDRRSAGGAAAACGARCARAARRRAGRAGRTLHDAGDHGPDGAPGAAGTDPVWTGAADQFQLRIRGRARGLHARFVRARPGRGARSRRALARRAARAGSSPGAPADHHARAVGRRLRSPRARPVLRPGAARVRPPHRQRERLRARGLGGDRARHREVPPRPQRLERPRLQLHRRPATARSSRAAPAASTWRSSARRRRASTASRPASRASARTPRVAADRGRRWTRSRGCIGWKLSLHGIPVAGAVTVTSAGGETQQATRGHAGHVPAHLGPPRRQRRPRARATCSTGSCRTCGSRAAQLRRAARRRHRARGVDEAARHAHRRRSAACCASPTAAPPLDAAGRDPLRDRRQRRTRRSRPPARRPTGAGPRPSTSHDRQHPRALPGRRDARGAGVELARDHGDPEARA